MSIIIMKQKRSLKRVVERKWKKKNPQRFWTSSFKLFLIIFVMCYKVGHIEMNCWIISLLPRFFGVEGKKNPVHKIKKNWWCVGLWWYQAYPGPHLVRSIFCRSWCHWNRCYVSWDRRRIQQIWGGIKNKNLIFRSKCP